MMRKKKKRTRHEEPKSMLRKIAFVFLTALMYLCTLIIITYGYPKLQAERIFANPDVLYYYSNSYGVASAVSSFLIFFGLFITLVALYNSSISPIHFVRKHFSRNKTTAREKRRPKNMFLCIVAIAAYVLLLLIAIMPLTFQKSQIEITNSGVIQYNTFNQIIETHAYTDLSEINVCIADLPGYHSADTRYTIQYTLNFQDGYAIDTYLYDFKSNKYRKRARGMLELDRIAKNYAPKIVGNLENIDKIKEATSTMDIILQILNS